MFWQKGWFERWAPLLVAAITLSVCIYFKADIALKFGENGWKASSLYSAVFNWSSIQSGFVFGIYGFIITKKDGFVGTISGTTTFLQFIAFTRRAYIGGFVLTFASLPLLVAEPPIFSADRRTFWFISIWFAFFTWTFCAFLRVAFCFGIMAATPDRPTRIPG